MKDEIWQTDAASWGNGWYDCVNEPIKISASSFLESQGNNKYDAINAIMILTTKMLGLKALLDME